MKKTAKRAGRGLAWGKIIAIIAIVAAMGAAWRYTPLSEIITAEHVGAWARAVRGVWWAPLPIILAYTPLAFVIFPRPLLTLFAVIAFGPWLGFLYSMTGIMVSAWVTYYVGRALPEAKVRRIAGAHQQSMTQRMRRHGLLAVLAIRNTPVAPFIVGCVVAGALRIRLWDYTAGTFLGMVPGVLATAVFGHQIARVFDDPDTVNYWVMGAVVVIFVLITYMAGRWLARK